MRRSSFLSAVVVTIACILLARTPSPRAEPVAEELFKYGSIGSEDQEGLPYWIWQVLPRLFADKLPPGGFGALGMIWEPNHDVPIGFAKKSVWGVERVAINCAFCHTAAYRDRPDGPRHIVLAAGAHQLNPQAYSRFLDSVAADPRFTPTEVMAAIGKMTELSWWDRGMYRYVLIPAVKKALLEHGTKFAWMDSRPTWGPGRIDPQNPFKFTTLSQPIDDTIGNSDIPPIWNMKARRGMALHWDGMNTEYREVLLSSGLGNGATLKSIDVGNIERVGAWLDTFPPPAFPAHMDGTLVDQGQIVFTTTCGGCHAPGGIRTGQVIPIDEIGTDRHRLDTWTANAATAFNDYTKGQPWAFVSFRKTNGMVAGLLDGIWLRGPYLHNGSVPTVADLLEPADARPKVFYRGYDVIDTDRVGFVSSGPDAERAGTKYDVSAPGNGNRGHEYGAALTPAQKRSLLEYLKRL